MKTRRGRGPAPERRAMGGAWFAMMLIAAVSLGTSALAQPETPPGGTEPPEPPAIAEAPLPDADAEAPGAIAPFVARLEALSPADPRAYFLLGEDVSAQAVSQEMATLARTLYVLAFELDRRRQAGGASGDPGLEASVCLALADLSPLEEDRRWLVALARSIDRRYASPDWSRAAQPSYSGKAGFKAAEFLGLVRSGDGNRARDLLNDPEVAAVLEEFQAMVGGLGASGMLREMMLQSRQWPCPQCGNQRIARLGETNPPRRGLCPTCHGNPGPELSRAELIGQLRFESGLLNGIQSSWSAQLTLDLGAPLREPAASELAPTMRVDPDAVYYRQGRWVSAP